MGISTGNGGRTTLSEINVTPLVDVMLVLLIIFMITAPMLTAGLDVDLPNARAPMLDVDDEKLLLTITKDQQVYLGEAQVPQGRLEEALRSNRKLQIDQAVYVHADESVPYGFVVQVFALIREAGIEKVGLVTDPLGSE
jgi:biopolymer transport protein TolR